MCYNHSVGRHAIVQGNDLRCLKMNIAQSPSLSWFAVSRGSNYRKCIGDCRTEL